MILMVLVAVATVAADAQDIGQPQKGGELAEQLCAECHAVRRDQGASPNPSAPPFAAIAAVPGMSSTALSAALQTSHRTMPNVILDSHQITNIIAYILSLRGGG